MSINTKYVLTEKEKEYLRDTDRYNSNIEKRIDKKFQRVPSRFQDLIEDMTLLYQSGYFDEEDAESIWKGLHTMDHNPNGKLERNTLRRSFSTDPNGSATDLRTTETVNELGHLFGSLFHILMRAAPGDRPWTDLLRGIHLFYATVPDGDPTDRLRDLEEISKFDAIEQRTSKSDSFIHSRSGTDLDSEYEYFAYKEEELTDPDSLITDVLKDNEIKPNNPLIESLRSSIDSLDTDTVLIDTDDHREAIEVELQKVIEGTELRKAIRLHRLMETDIELLNKKWRGPDRDKITKVTFQQKIRKQSGSEKVESWEIASELNEESSDNLVTTALKKMTNDSDDPQLWTQYPLFKKQGDGWELTPYGELCGRYLVSGQNFVDELYNYGLKNGDINTKYGSVISEVLHLTGLDDSSVGTYADA
jgi:hypothetical protein